MVAEATDVRTELERSVSELYSSLENTTPRPDDSILTSSNELLGASEHVSSVLSVRGLTELCAYEYTSLQDLIDELPEEILSASEDEDGDAPDWIEVI